MGSTHLPEDPEFVLPGPSGPSSVSAPATAKMAPLFVGAAQLSSKVGTKEAEANGDTLVCLAQTSYREPKDWYAGYQVKIPWAGLRTV